MQLLPSGLRQLNLALAPPVELGDLGTARERSGLTQAEVSKRTGIQPTYVSDIERGVRNPSYEMMAALARH